MGTALRQEGLPVLIFWEEIVKLFAPHKAMSQLVPFIVAEDNEAAIQIARKGRCPTMRHISRTHRVDMDRLHETCTNEKVQLRYINTHSQTADILTNHFTRVDT